MRILFISLLDYASINEKGLYTDLLRKLRDCGNEVYVISPIERRNAAETKIIKEAGATTLKLKIGNIQKTNIVEKGITTVTIERQFISAIKKYFCDVKFDLVLYPTPPITFCGAVEYVKKRDGARTYLMLKDIFPQNAVDLGMLSTAGLKGLIYRSFRRKERRLYNISDKIGCMSRANLEYILAHNPDVDASKIEVFPNCIEVIDKSVSTEEREAIRRKYDIPFDKKVFVYGGNLGRPQAVGYIVECLRSLKKRTEVFFLIVGDGTDYNVLSEFVEAEQPDNVKLLQRLPKEDYDTLVGACDVGLIFLDHRFTIPNFPSRLLSYMQAKLPVIAATDTSTDIGQVIVDGGFGWWCESNSVSEFEGVLNEALEADCEELGENGFRVLCEEYSVERNVGKILGLEIINNRKGC